EDLRIHAGKWASHSQSSHLSAPGDSQRERPLEPIVGGPCALVPGVRSPFSSSKTFSEQLLRGLCAPDARQLLFGNPLTDALFHHGRLHRSFDGFQFRFYELLVAQVLFELQKRGAL